jgi:hypothetical protein
VGKQMRILESDSEIRKKILGALLEEVKNTFNRSIPQIKDKIESLIRESITSEPEYISLVGGQLRAELGIPDASSKIQELLNIWVSNIQVEINQFRINNIGLSGGFSINCIKSDYSDVLSSSAAQVEDFIRGYSLPWLNWLLLEGGTILVKDHIVVVGNSNASRTGDAIMKTLIRGSWRVPSEFAGTENNNWITRAIDKLEDRIFNIFKNTIESNIL